MATIAPTQDVILAYIDGIDHTTLMLLETAGIFTLQQLTINPELHVCFLLVHKGPFDPMTNQLASQAITRFVDLRQLIGRQFDGIGFADGPRTGEQLYESM